MALNSEEETSLPITYKLNTAGRQDTAHVKVSGWKA